MPRKVVNHLHRYKKVNLAAKGEYWVYKCQKPTCSHYVRIDMAEGKLCECNRCGEPMILGKLQLRGSNSKPMKYPHCAECTKKRGNKNVETISEFLSRDEIPSKADETFTEGDEGSE